MKYVDPYPFFVGLGVGLAYHWLWNSNARRCVPVYLFHLLFIFLLFGAWLGAKIFYLYWGQVPFPLWPSVLTGGGFVFHGGLLGGLTFYLLLIFVKPQLHVMVKDIVLALLLGHALGRVGCYFSGCCYGSPVLGYIPVQLFEALGLITIFLLVKKINGSFLQILGTYLCTSSLLRLFCEVYRHDERGVFAFGAFSVSLTSIFASGFLFLGITVLLINTIFNNHKYATFDAGRRY